MKKSFFVSAAIMILFLASFWIISCEQEDSDISIAETAVAEDRGTADSKVFPPNARPYGKSYVDWTVNWWQKFMVFGCNENPFTNAENAMFLQFGPVYFLAGLSKEGGSVEITIPQGKAILFPLVNYINDYPCPDQTFGPAPGQSLEHFLRAGALSALSGASALSVEIDGLPVSNLSAYQFTSRLFSFTGNPELVSCFDGCVTGEAQKAVTSGYYLMLKPMKKGPHVVHYHAEIPTINAVQDGTYYIEVI